jgi:hypothetical protein
MRSKSVDARNERPKMTCEFNAIAVEKRTRKVPVPIIFK